MILIGKQADRLNKEQWERMSFLSGHFLDVLQGITTLKLFGRAKDQIKVIGRLSQEFKDSTLRVLRVAFLSALVLELVSTISTALIAVYLGLTLLDGEVTFFSAFFILLLAPEFYTPFRQLGAAFHTGMAGKTSILKYEEFMQRPPSLPVGGESKLDKPIQGITIKDLTFTYKIVRMGYTTLRCRLNVMHLLCSLVKAELVNLLWPILWEVFYRLRKEQLLSMALIYVI